MNLLVKAFSYTIDPERILPLNPSKLAAWLHQARRRRELVLDPDLFGERGWDMLLDMYVSSARAKNTAITAACSSSGVPPTTALRWVSILENKGLVERSSDPNDARRQLLQLTEQGRQSVEAALRVIMETREKRSSTAPAPE